MSIKERKLQAEIKQLRAQCAARAEWGIKLAQAEVKIEELERHIEDLRELREFDRIKLERLKGMGV